MPSARSAVSFTFDYRPSQRFADDTNVKLAKRLNVAAEFLRGHIVRNISTPTRTAGPSKPGEFPHADTGKLRQSIYVEPATPNNLEARVGTNLVYGRVHEMKNRSFLQRTIYEKRAELIRILETGRP